MLLASTCPDPGNRALGLKELFFNAIEHGNLGITYDEKTRLEKEDSWKEELQRRLNLPENQDKYVVVHLERHAHEIVFIITDQGAGFDWRPYETMDPQRMFDSHGRGIAMARSLCFDELRYRGRGNEVMAIISLNQSGS